MTPGPDVEPPPAERRTAGADAVRSSALVPFLLGRLLLLLVLIVAAASAIFLITSVAPGDAASSLFGSGAGADAIARERARLELDQPLTARYARWLARAVRFDLGRSSRYQQPVAALVRERTVNSVLLGIAALTLATLIGIPVGALAGSGRWRWLSSSVGGVSLAALSCPPLLTSLVLTMLAARTGWLPVGAMSSIHAEEWPLAERVADALWHLTLPACALGLPLAAMIERLQAAAVNGGRHERHVLAARALGLPFSRVLWRNLWRPTLAPVAGVFGLAAGSVLSGSLAVEIVTGWPGLGRLMFEALAARDVPLAAGCAAAAAAVLAVWTSVADVLVWWLDPRTRAEASS